MNDTLGNWKRTQLCGTVTAEQMGQEICVMGWVQRRRDHGGLIFIDLRRQREGLSATRWDGEPEDENRRGGN